MKKTIFTQNAKKGYNQPTMQVVEFNAKQPLLTASENWPEEDYNNGELG